jgi:hypothetical protein
MNDAQVENLMNILQEIATAIEAVANRIDDRSMNIESIANSLISISNNER